MPRPKETPRTRLTAYLLPETMQKIRDGRKTGDRSRNTPGKVIDKRFGVKSPPSPLCKSRVWWKAKKTKKL